MFIHIFSYRFTPYHFNKNDPEDWMARHFFSGGTMPAMNCCPTVPDRSAWKKRGSFRGIITERLLGPG